MDWAISYVKLVVGNVISWFVSGMNYLGAWKFLFGAFSVYCGYRFILIPLLGGSLNFGFGRGFKDEVKGGGMKTDNNSAYVDQYNGWYRRYRED